MDQILKGGRRFTALHKVYLCGRNFSAVVTREAYQALQNGNPVALKWYFRL